MSDAIRTDFVPSDVILRRQQMADASGWEPLFESGTISVKFSDSFDVFAANTAHALRKRLIYRSDNGRMARGLVRNSGHLLKLHAKNTSRPAMARLDSIVLAYLFVRRGSKHSKERWVMGIMFDEVLVDMETIKPPPVDSEANKKADKHIVMSFLTRAIVASMDMGCKGRCVRSILEYAVEIGYPQNLGLWFYDGAHVANYLNTSKEIREKQPRHGLPLSGKMIGLNIPGEWQVFWIRSQSRIFGNRLDGQDWVSALNRLYRMARDADIETTLFAGRYSGGMQDAYCSSFLAHYQDLKRGRSTKKNGQESVHHFIKDCR